MKEEKNENVELTLPKPKIKKQKHRVVLVSPTWVMYDDGSGSLTWTNNIWKDLKIGDEVLI